MRRREFLVLLLCMVAPLQAQEGPAPTLQAEWVFTIEASIGAAIEMGETVDGVRRSIPITGGSFAGPELRGEVVPGGADYQQTRPDGSTFIRAVYMIRTDDGALINVVNEGLIVPPGVAGNDGLYFRTSPRFTAPLGPYSWLNNGIFVSAIRMSPEKPNTVIIDVYRVR